MTSKLTPLPHAEPSRMRGLTLWLLIMVLLVSAMIVLGGATRLTNSGLSITEWKPITGALPPLSHEAWLSEFEKYKQIPEFEAEHPDMTLKGFEFIYFMEWSHRQLGRIIGLVYALPFLVFLKKGALAGRARLYFAILLLIGVQGAIGWWMVHSGLGNDRVDVSQYRLAVHLGVAFIILGLLFWLWRENAEGPSPKSPVMAKRAGGLALLIYVQIIAGAFVAGTHSGKTYNSWPLMDGDFIPSGYFAQSPLWRNVFENAAAIQFNHRMLAYLIVAAVVYIYWRARAHERLTRSAAIVLGLVIWQAVLGIWTLLAAAPLNLSLLHQFSAVILFLAGLWLWRRAVYARP